MKVYLVIGRATECVYAVFRHQEDAEIFVRLLDEHSQVVERTLQGGQPQNRGYNE